MSKTSYKIVGKDIYINGKPTYSEIPNVNPNALGLLFNARFIQGIFRDENPENAGKYDRFGKKFDPDQNVEDLIKALPEWYRYGLRAFTVGLQGGGPIYTFEDWGGIWTNAFSTDGKKIDPDCLARLTKIVKAADEIGMLVIVSMFYQGQFQYFDHDAARIEASKTAAKALAEMGYDNIIIEIGNEYDILNIHAKETSLHRHDNMAPWIAKVREWSGGKFAVGSSMTGGGADERVIRASDIILIHGNQARREELNSLVRQIRKWESDKPIVVNEDSPLITQVDVAIENHFSWGYYNDMTKQEPPCDWGVTKGEDEYFALRIADAIGIEVPESEQEIYLQGFEKDMSIEGGRFIRVASRHPEQIDRVRFYEDGKLLDISYAEPFMIYATATWIQLPYIPKEGAEIFTAEVVKLDGTVLKLTQDLKKVEG